MLSPRDQRYAARLRSLIEEGARLATRETASDYGMSRIQDEDAIALHAWIARVENIVTTVFGQSSTQARHLASLMPKGPKRISFASQVQEITGLLIGAADDLENGFLMGREMLLASEFFDSVLQQGKHLLSSGYKDVAAILGRIVLENALRKIAAAESIDSQQKASKINDDLKAKERYSQPQWRQLQTWLDIGNAAAHGNFEHYSAEAVATMFDGIEQFLALQLHA